MEPWELCTFVVVKASIDYTSRPDLCRVQGQGVGLREDNLALDFSGHFSGPYWPSFLVRAGGSGQREHLLRVSCAGGIVSTVSLHPPLAFGAGPVL